MATIRYRTGFDENTGQLLVGQPHLAQSIRKVWRTRMEKVWMLLDFGSDNHSRLGEDITADLALALYNDLTEDLVDWEPEYELSALQLVLVTKTGKLGLRHEGIYYPEGRFGNYDIAIPLTMTQSDIGVGR